LRQNCRSVEHENAFGLGPQRLLVVRLLSIEGRDKGPVPTICLLIVFPLLCESSSCNAARIAPISISALYDVHSWLSPPEIAAA